MRTCSSGCGGSESCFLRTFLPGYPDLGDGKLTKLTKDVPPLRETKGRAEEDPRKNKTEKRGRGEGEGVEEKKKREREGVSTENS